MHAIFEVDVNVMIDLTTRNIYVHGKPSCLEIDSAVSALVCFAEGKIQRLFSVVFVGTHMLCYHSSQLVKAGKELGTSISPPHHHTKCEAQSMRD